MNFFRSGGPLSSSGFLSPPATLTVQSQDNGGGNQFSVQTELNTVYLRAPACDGNGGGAVREEV